MYIRFVRLKVVDGMRAREGFFCAAYELKRHPEVDMYTRNYVEELLSWFEKELEIPGSFTRSKLNKLHRNNSFGISWFKPTTKIYLAKAFELTALLDQHGYPIEVLKSAR
ncbi:hypothetical protein A9Q97_04565, partial [Rhodospirillales bacterium 47_12_T64]